MADVVSVAVGAAVGVQQIALWVCPRKLFDLPQGV
jgi:hypothetical protein